MSKCGACYLSRRRFIFAKNDRIVAVKDDRHQRSVVHVDALDDPAHQFPARLRRILDFRARIPVAAEVPQKVRGLDQIVVVDWPQRFDFVLQLTASDQIRFLVQKPLFPRIFDTLHHFLEFADPLQVLRIPVSYSHCVVDPVDHAIRDFERGEGFDQLLVDLVDPGVSLSARRVTALRGLAPEVAGILPGQIRRAHDPVAIIGEIRRLSSRTAQTDHPISQYVRGEAGDEREELLQGQKPSVRRL